MLGRCVGASQSVRERKTEKEMIYVGYGANHYTAIVTVCLRVLLG